MGETAVGANVVAVSAEDPQAANTRMSIKSKPVWIKIFIKTLGKSTVAHYHW